MHPDFELEIVAQEPTVMDPVDLLFDERGRLFVLEMPGYPFSEGQSRIIKLTDEDQDGLFEGRHVVADKLRQATSFMRYRDGFLVAAPPNLVWLRDANHDEILDTRDTLLTGFSEGNLQHNFNGLTYGLDNWIYGANGGNGGKVTWSNRPENIQDIGRSDFRFRLSDQKFELLGRSSGGDSN